MQRIWRLASVSRVWWMSRKVPPHSTVVFPTFEKIQIGSCSYL
jgi:hypothetical protein